MPNKKTGGAKEKEGVISISKTGVGFVDTGDGEDLLIRPTDLGTALSRDTVAVVPAGFERGRRAGKVVRVIERAQERFVGRIVRDGDSFLFQADRRRVNQPFYIVSGETRENTRAVLLFTGWNEEKNLPQGNIVEILGAVGDHEVEMRALLLREGFEADFPLPVRKEAEVLETSGTSLISEGAGSRRDMRGDITFTIDPADAKDFDDALSVRDIDDTTVEVGIHIADVSYFVQPGSAIDLEARRRATSVYLVDRTIPMLPPILSENLCSLRPNEDRLATSAVFTLEKKSGTIQDVWFGETVIHSDKRFTYEEAQEVLDTGDGPFHKELSLLSSLSGEFRKRRSVKGAVSFDTDEVKVEVDEHGTPVRIYLKERKETNLLVEDFMLLANESVAAYMERIAKKSGLERPFIYRTHDTPNEEKISLLSEFLTALGYSLPTQKDGGVSGKDLNRLFKEVEGSPEEYLIKTTAIRSMAKAIYTTKNIGHFGLAFDTYTHFTSPIRRYPDLIVHRLLKSALFDEILTQAEMARLEEDARHSTEREIAATDAERDSIKLKQVEFLSKQVGKEFDALITGVTERGIFVEERSTRSEGMIRVRDMKDDYYSFDEKGYCLVGAKTKKTYRLGDTLRVRLVSANPIDRMLDFVLA